MELIVCKYFKLTKKIGSGSFGEIFHAINNKTNEEFAVKLEKVNTKQPQLQYEAKLYQYLHQDISIVEKGIPRVYYYSTEGDFNVMVMDLLGPSLEDLFVMCNRAFGLKTTLMIADQIINRIEFIHSRQFLHRDIKPDNFLIGSGKKKYKIYITDFGLSKRYIGKDTKHIPYRDNKNLTGTARYASINTHLGIEQSRRDDLESIGYMLSYFMNGSLPWQNLKASNKRDKYQKILEKKLSTHSETLYKNLPIEFVEYMKYCRNLSFDSKPDYTYIKNLFKNVFIKSGYEYDLVYDWDYLASDVKEIKKDEVKEIEMEKLKESK